MKPDPVLSTLPVLVVFSALVLGGGCALGGGRDASRASAVTAERLRCEYLVDPLAVERARPRLGWILSSSARGVRQTAYRILVSSSPEKLASGEGDLWDSGRVESSETNQIAYAGKPLGSLERAFWKVRVWTNAGGASPWSAPGTWRAGFVRPEDWGARWVGCRDPLPEGDPTPAQPSPYFRKEFELPAAPKRAVLTATALGLYELRLNGAKVGDALLSPEWTDYRRRIQYQAYDATGLLRKGRNAIGAILGEGWYAGRIGISHVVPDGKLRNHYGRRLALLARLDVELEDGRTVTVATDASWRATNRGPILSSCILDGEAYDSRLDMPGWDSAGFDDSAWSAVEELPAPAAALVAQPNEPVRVTEELRPVRISEPSPGKYVVDFGQVLSGVTRIRVRGEAGTTVTLRHAEVLSADGNIYRDNLRMDVYAKDPSLKYGKYLGARQEDRYTLRGLGEEVFQPRFTYHGFRYVEVTGLRENPTPDSIVALAFHSAPPVAGSFECSSPLLNRLARNIVWTHRDNMHSVPTDCPQRDERCGWMGDMLVFAQTACFDMDMAAFFTKWVGDIRDAQADDGRYPDIAPHPFDPNARFSGVPAWGDAGTVVPWRMYVNYGDRRVLEEHFDSARRWVDWIAAQNPDRLWKNRRHNDYGDWLNGDTLRLEGFGYPKGGAEMPKEVFATAFFQHSASLVAKMAAALGREEDARRYAALADEIRAAFNAAYVKDDGTIHGDTQSGYALALGFDLLPEAKRPLAAQRMVQRIEEYKGHISTGFHTTVHLMNELTRWGHNDVAYQLVGNRTIPSWGYTIEQGATTIWERWDGYVEGRGFQDPGMNSFCHYAFGSVGEWMYRTILGISPDEAHPGWAHFVLRPRPGKGLEWAKGSYESIRGRIASEWRVRGQDLEFTCTVPPNATATIYVPAKGASLVTEGGKPAREAEGLRFLREEEGAVAFEASSGTYRFVSRGFAAP
ncbi:MAG: glycoside hydrolase family 78 protein [Planctomycetota bacterium]